MNPSNTQPNPNGISSESLFEKAFDSQGEFEQPEVEDNSVIHSEESLKSIGNNWVEFMSKTTEISEGPGTRVEVEQTRIETQFSQPLRIFETGEAKPDTRNLDIIEKQKDSSIFEEAGLKLNIAKGAKDVVKSIFGAFSLFKEIFMDTVTLVVGKKEKQAEKVDPNPEKAKAAAEKKAEKQRKNANIRAFYEGLKASMSAIVAPEAVRMETQEKENINRTAKIGNESYKGIKDSFGRLTVYAASMFEREQTEQEHQAKKQEKEMKMASVKGPDLNLDKAAEGGFLSATGGQGAG